jgi:hypothetical protein
MNASNNHEIVRHLSLDKGAELDQVVAYLPRAVADGLMRALDETCEAYRYDAHSQRAYFFRRGGMTVDIWSWDHVQSAAEYGDLVTLIVRLDVPFDLEQAILVYVGATGRIASQPFASPSSPDPERSTCD